MENKLLVTHSLLANWKWWLDFEGDDDSTARESFENTLNKICVDNIYMKTGGDFEKLVEGIDKNWTLKFPEKQIFECAGEIAKIISGGTWQVSCKKDVMIDDQPILLYGRTDVLRGPEIFDIKFVSYYEPRKYIKSTQHKMYFECFPGTERFTYLVSDGVEVYRESYDRDETDSIIPIVRDWWSWVNQFPKYREIYKEKWKAF